MNADALKIDMKLFAVILGGLEVVGVAISVMTGKPFDFMFMGLAAHYVLALWGMCVGLLAYNFFTVRMEKRNGVELRSDQDDVVGRYDR